MVRTKEVKVVLEKSSRKKVTSSSMDDKKSKGGKYSGGNPVCPRETPVWQKPITNFFTESEEKSAGPSADVNSNKSLSPCPDDNMTDLEVKDNNDSDENSAGHSFINNEKEDGNSNKSFPNKKEEDGSSNESLMTCPDDDDNTADDLEVKESWWE